MLTTNTSTCNRRRLMRDTAIKLLPIASVNTKTSVRVFEKTDNAGRALYMAIELLEQLRLGEPSRQRLRIKIGRDQHEGVVMRRSGRRAWAHIDALLGGTNAADIFVGRLAGLTFGERGNRGRDAIGDPVIDTRATAFRIGHDQREARRAGR